MTNYEWLLQMGGEERQAWFDAQHVDANDALTRKSDVREDDVCANDANVAHDSREKLEADMRRILEGVCEHVCRYHNVPALLVYGPNEYGNEEQLEELLNDAIKLLDRQAAITERELRKQCEWPSLAAQPDEEAYERIANLTDDLETAYAKNRVLRAHISKMQNGRNGWHIKAEKLQKQIDELTAERDALADDLLTCNKEREQYRELFSKAITHAHEIVNLQP